MNQNLEFMKESVKIGFKSMIEYRGNFYSSLITMITAIILSIFVLLVISNSFEFNFSVQEIILFTLLKQIGNNIFWPFVKVNGRIFKVILSGKINSFLTKPTNIFLIHLFDGFKARWVVNTALLIITIFGFIFYFNLDFWRFLIIFLCSVLIFGYLNVSIVYFFNSLGFFKMDVGTKMFFRMNNELSSFPPTLYQSFNYRFILFLFPMVLHGISILYFFNRLSVEYFLIALCIAFAISLVFNIITYNMWRIGLKKYEAYG